MSGYSLVFECPSCGSKQYVEIGDRFKCGHCGTMYQKDRRNSEVYLDLAYAVNERQEAKFDAARRRYDSIIEKYKSGPDTEEAYWGRFLCEQYVLFYQNDKSEFIPSFWRVSDAGCMQSNSFKKARELGLKSGNAENYDRLAKLIEEYKEKYRKVVKRSPEGSQIFICFRNTGTNSNLGYDIVNAFGRDYRIFFSQESLKYTDTNDYEPDIYHALQTARVMLLICSSREDLESKWVHNEWSRFWKFTKSSNKLIIPIFRGSFKPSDLPEELQKCQGHKEDVNLISDLRARFDQLFKNDESSVPLTSFAKSLSIVESNYNSGNVDDAKIMLNKLIQESAGRPHDHISALLLQVKILSAGYKHPGNASAQSALTQAVELAKRSDIEIKDMPEYRRYSAAIGRKRFKKILLALLVVLAVAGGTVGVILGVRDPMVDLYLTGRPASVEVDYGSNYLNAMPTLTTVSKKGKEETVAITESMVSGYDPTKIGLQTVTVTYEDMSIQVSINVLKYSLNAPASLTLKEGKVTWENVAQAESYVLQVNDQVIDGITTNFYEGDLFSASGVYTVKVKAVADPAYGKDSAFTTAITVASLKEASGLRIEGQTLSWDALEGCSQYDVYVNGAKVGTTATNTYACGASGFAGGANLVYVLPVGVKNLKLLTDLQGDELTDYEHNGELTLYKLSQAPSLAYHGDTGKLTWDALADGTIYDVYINGNLFTTVGENTCVLETTAVAAGENTLYVVPQNGSYLVSEPGNTDDFEHNGEIKLTKLAPVSGISVSNNRLTWNAVEGAVRYDVLLDGEVVGQTAETSYALTASESSAQYTVRAIGPEGVLSSDVSTDGASFSQLSAPSGVAIDEAGVLSWGAVSGAKGYEIYINGEVYTMLDASKLSFTLTGELEQGTYTVGVAAKGNGTDLLSSACSPTVEYAVTETMIYISTEAELLNMKLNLNASYVLNSDITLTAPWTPVGTTASPFVGRLDGKGHTISGLKLTAASSQGTGLFGVIGEGGVVKDVTFSEIEANGSTYGRIGAVAGINRGTISGVTVSGSVQSEGDYVGGIAGRNYGSIYSCTNRCSRVVGKKNVGGIAGDSSVSSYDAQLHSCTNEGAVTGNFQVGGIMGSVSISKRCTIYGMTNSGSVTSNTTYAGGIFGTISGSSGQIGTLSGCTNSGAVSATDYAGGCFGYRGGYITVTESDLDAAKNCTNSGTVTVTDGTHTGDIYVN